MSILSSKQMKMVCDYSNRYMRDGGTLDHIDIMIEKLERRSDINVDITVEGGRLVIPKDNWPLVIKVLENCRKTVSDRMAENEEKILDILGIGESRCDS